MLVSKLILFDYHTNTSEKNVSLNYYVLKSEELIETTRVAPKNMLSNYEKIAAYIIKFPGLRFHELKKEVDIANGTLQHHISSLAKSGNISIQYDNATPRYFSNKN